MSFLYKYISILDVELKHRRSLGRKAGKVVPDEGRVTGRPTKIQSDE